MFKVHIPHAGAISLTITSHSDQLQLCQSLLGGGGATSAGRSAKFDSISEIG